MTAELLHLRDLNPGRALRSRRSRKITGNSECWRGCKISLELVGGGEIQVAQKSHCRRLLVRPMRDLGPPLKGGHPGGRALGGTEVISGNEDPGRALLPTLQWGWPLLRHGLSLPCVSPNSRSRKSSPCSPQIASSGRSSNCTPRWPEPGQSGAPNSTPHHHSHRILKLFQRRLCDDL